MNWVVVLVAGLIGVLSGARLRIGGAATIFAAVLVFVGALGLAYGIETTSLLVLVLLSAVSLQFGYLVGAFALTGRPLPRWVVRRRLNKTDKGDRAQ